MFSNLIGNLSPRDQRVKKRGERKRHIDWLNPSTLKDCGGSCGVHVCSNVYVYEMVWMFVCEIECVCVCLCASEQVCTL